MTHPLTHAAMRRINGANDMTDTQHTPGPWRADGEPWNRIVWSSADNRVCFMAHSNGLDDDRDIATSNLIAAAPDLLAALIALLRFAENTESELGIVLGSANSARAAIAKARGKA